MTQTLRDILNDARDELKEWMQENEGYTPGDLMELAADDIDLATTEPELGPAFDGSPTPTNIIAANVYEAVSNHLHGIIQEVEDEIEEENEDAA